MLYITVLRMSDMPARLERPRDTNQLAKRIVEIATGEEVVQDPPDNKNPHAQALGRLGGRKGGLMRAKKLSPKRRREIARKAAEARYKKKD